MKSITVLFTEAAEYAKALALAVERATVTTLEYDLYAVPLPVGNLIRVRTNKSGRTFTFGEDVIDAEGIIDLPR